MWYLKGLRSKYNATSKSNFAKNEWIQNGFIEFITGKYTAINTQLSKIMKITEEHITHHTSYFQKLCLLVNSSILFIRSIEDMYIHEFQMDNVLLLFICSKFLEKTNKKQCMNAIIKC